MHCFQQREWEGAAQPHFPSKRVILLLGPPFLGQLYKAWVKTFAERSAIISWLYVGGSVDLWENLS